MSSLVLFQAACRSLLSFANSLLATNTILFSIAYQFITITMNRRQAPALNRSMALQAGSLLTPQSRPRGPPDNGTLDEILALVKKIENDVATIKMQLASNASAGSTTASAPPAYTSRIYPQIRPAPYN